MSVDEYQADEVEVVIARHSDGWRLWVNLEGRNVLRIYRIETITWRDYDGDSDAE